jgi:hypothetical protein
MYFSLMFRGSLRAYKVLWIFSNYGRILRSYCGEVFKEFYSILVLGALFNYYAN